MSAENASGLLGRNQQAGERETEGKRFSTSHYSTHKRPCLPPQEGAKIKLDTIEQRLQAARAIGDDDAWARYYLAWMKLYPVAFGFARSGDV